MKKFYLLKSKNTRIATVKINGREAKYGVSLGNAKIEDKFTVISLYDFYRDLILVDVDVNGVKSSVNSIFKEEVLEFLKSFDVNARLEGKNQNTISVYNYKTKTFVKYEYKKSMKLVDVLSKSGFVNAKTGSACYTEISKYNYKITAKNIFAHHLDLSETEIYSKVKDFSVDDILFMGAAEKLDFNIDSLYILYISKTYNGDVLEKIFLDMNFISTIYGELRRSFGGFQTGNIYNRLDELQLEIFIKTRSKLVDRYMKNSAHLTIDNIPHGIGYPIPPNQYQNLISVNVNGENIKLDIMDIDGVAKFIEIYDYGHMNLIPMGSNKIYVYNYKTKTTIQFIYTKEMKLEDLLKAAGFVNAETGVACYTKTGYNSYKVTAVNSHLHKIGLTRQELVSFMKTLNGLDLMFFEDILKIPHDDLTSEEIFIRYSTIMYLLKTKDTQITMGIGVVIDATNTFESTKLLEELGYPQFLTDTIGMNYRSSRVGTTFSELIAMDVIMRGEEVKNAVDFVVAYLLMRLNNNLRFVSDNAFVETPVEGASNQTIIYGSEWNKYFQETYGTENVKWMPQSYQHMIENPQTLYGTTQSEMAKILGNGWTASSYGNSGTGWKFINNAHNDLMIFQHNADGIHGGAYYGFSNGITGTVKLVGDDYIHLAGDKATIIQMGH